MEQGLNSAVGSKVINFERDGKRASMIYQIKQSELPKQLWDLINAALRGEPVHVQTTLHEMPASLTDRNSFAPVLFL